MYGTSLTLYHKIPTFNDPETALENIVIIGENAGKQHFPLFPTMFSVLTKRIFNFVVTFIFLSENAFNLEQSKILSLGKGLRASS